MKESINTIKIFPTNFIWGTATASYQIEGHPLADGAAPSIWHEFSHIPGKIHNNDNGDIACDHYHRYEEDILHLRNLGVKAYRFSIAWPRIVPKPYTVNQKGINFYKRIIGKLLESGIEPFVTLFHWDTPLWLENIGGFTSRESVNHFLFYAETIFKEFGNSVTHWISVNEPLVYATQGYISGEMAPGKKRDIRGMAHAAHHLLLSHAKAYHLLHNISPRGKIGVAEAQIWTKPLRNNSKADTKAAFLMDKIINRMYIDPITFGRYPKEVIEKIGNKFPKNFEKDLEEMENTLDFVGINYYTSNTYRYSLLTPITHAKEVPTPGVKRSAMWEIYPEGLYNLLVRVRDEYNNLPCYITENGYPLKEDTMKDPLEDDERIEYLREHLKSAKRAMEDDVNLKGYFVWSLLDNFEWAHGYDMRFGIIRVDFKSLKRKWKKSAYWYRDTISSGKIE